jgi:hypothetical protein
MKGIGNSGESNQQDAHNRQELECSGSSTAFGRDVHRFTFNPNF